MKLKFIPILLFMCFFSGILLAQQRKITGKVTDNKQQALPGVNVTIKGTTTGTSTNANGLFELNAKSGSILIISYIGYEPQELVLGNQITYDIILQESETTLNEVVVVGYQSITRKSVTTAISSVNDKDIAPTTTNNIGQTLQGKVPGLQVFQGSGAPGAQPKLLIRGFATITGGSNPLIVVDGVVTSFGGLNDINPIEIIENEYQRIVLRN